MPYLYPVEVGCRGFLDGYLITFMRLVRNLKAVKIKFVKTKYVRHINPYIKKPPVNMQR